ncbi:Polyketide cyclase/dehydrase [Penicillium lagena]|uniref:Polyketide cyclase/dehydrase n=1 Tax=Penicillium lagena TaxID=94218 RepID=UPI0025418CE7|nr:Polyketide cyclase/dehydrase [Penicillium lagena]KAJ5624831.1 Polyketide cyclase/dehydrase [Penicillium lagena]
MIETRIEIAAPPAKVREVFLNFLAHPEWHTKWLKEVKPADDSKTGLSLVPGDKVHVQIGDMKFTAEIRENSENLFQWQGPPIFTVAGLHSFHIEPTNDGSSTIFKQTEDLKGLMAWLMSPYLLGRSMAADFDAFNKDLKARAET